MLLNSCQSMPVGGRSIEETLHKHISETGKIEVDGEVKSMQDVRG